MSHSAAHQTFACNKKVESASCVAAALYRHFSSTFADSYSENKNVLCFSFYIVNASHHIHLNELGDIASKQWSRSLYKVGGGTEGRNVKNARGEVSLFTSIKPVPVMLGAQLKRWTEKMTNWIIYPFAYSSIHFLCLFPTSFFSTSCHSKSWETSGTSNCH